MVQAFARSADPTLALGSLVRLLDVGRRPARPGRGTAGRPACAIGWPPCSGAAPRSASTSSDTPSIGTHSTTTGSDTSRPSVLGLREALLVSVGADPLAHRPRSAMPLAVAYDALRVEYRRHLLRLAARDLGGHLAVGDVAAELADLAAATLEAGLAIARAEIGGARGHRAARGGRHGQVRRARAQLRQRRRRDLRRRAGARRRRGDGDRRTASRLAAAPGPGLQQHDRARARSGRSTLRCGRRATPGRWSDRWPAIARTTSGGRRPGSSRRCSRRGRSPGTSTSGSDFVDAVRPDGVAGGEPARSSSPTCRRCGDGSSRRIPASHAERQLKLGPGGLRDVEFAVQLLQLVHGRGDETLRSGTTLVALDALSAGGYVGREDGAELRAAYEFLRSLEHRIQLFRLRRTQLLPEGEDDLRRLGRSLGFRSDPARELHERVAPAHPRGAPAAREAVLPPAAVCGRAAARPAGAADARGRAGATRRARLRRPGGGAAPSRGAHDRRQPSRRDPAHAAPGTARLVRRRR